LNLQARNINSDTEVVVQTQPIWSSPPQPGDLQAFTLQGGTRACLLIHGFAGTPPEMRGLGEYLNQHGYGITAPLLAGHGLTPEAMAATRWRDWSRSAEVALQELQRDYREVFVAGQSLGGSLALHLAATHPGISGVVAMAAMGSPAFWKDWRLQVLPGLKYFVRWYSPSGEPDLGDPQALRSLRSYTRRPTVCLESMVSFIRTLAAELPQIKVPVVLMHGRRDRTVPVENAPFILDRLGSADKQIVWFERSGHAISVDLEKDTVNATVLRWLNAH
jgi:carboxylesterase